MHRPLNRSRRCCIASAFAVASVTAVLSGCLAGIGWLPDSSSFVFTTESRKLVLFDVAQKTTRVLVDDVKSNTFWPAVDLGGKKIATAGFELDGTGKGKLRISIHDLQGGIAHHSPALDWDLQPPQRGRIDPKEISTMLFWDPAGKKLLAYAGMGDGGGKGLCASGLYDPETQKVVLFPGTIPSLIGGTPLRPDGQGFLLRKSGGRRAPDEFLFVEWSARERKLVLNFENAPRTETALRLLQWPSFCTSHWQESVGVASGPEGRWRFDTAQGVVTFVAGADADSTFEEKVVSSRAILESGLHLLVLTAPNGGVADRFDVLSWNPATKQRQVLMENVNNRLYGLFPSPNRKHVVVRVYEGDRRGPGADMLFLIDNDGKASHKLDLFEAFGAAD